MSPEDQKICIQAINDFHSGKISEKEALRIYKLKGVGRVEALESIHCSDDCIEIEDPEPAKKP
jgi:hypothetical protein